MPEDQPLCDADICQMACSEAIGCSHPATSSDIKPFFYLENIDGDNTNNGNECLLDRDVEGHSRHQKRQLDETYHEEPMETLSPIHEKMDKFSDLSEAAMLSSLPDHSDSDASLDSVSSESKSHRATRRTDSTILLQIKCESEKALHEYEHVIEHKRKHFHAERQQSIVDPASYAIPAPPVESGTQSTCTESAPESSLQCSKSVSQSSSGTADSQNTSMTHSQSYYR